MQRTATLSAVLALGAARLVLSVGAALVAPALGLAQEPPPIVFAQRIFSSRSLGIDQLRGQRQDGSLVLRESNGVLRTIVGPDMHGGLIAGVMDPDVRHDAARIAFSGYSLAENAWRIFTVRVDGSELRQVTQVDRELDLSRFGTLASSFLRYDDLDPCWLPDGRICFVSTRYPSLAPDGRAFGTNLFVVNEDGSDLHRITTERFGADTPTVDPVTGRIVYSRWWTSGANLAGGTPPAPTPGYYAPPPPPPANRVEETLTESDTDLSLRPEEVGGVNTWTLATIRPDGAGLEMFAGAASDRVRSVAYRPSFTRTGEALAVFLRGTPVPGRMGTWGLRLFPRGAHESLSLGGPQVLAALPTEVAVPFQYESAEELPDGRLLVVGRPMGSTADLDIWIQPGAEQMPQRLTATTSLDELGAVPLLSRPLPPMLADEVTTRLPELPPRSVEEAYASGGSFTFLCENIFANAPVAQRGIGLAPSVGAAAFIEFWMNPQGAVAGRGTLPILVDRVPVPPSGRIEIELPAGVPLFEVLRRSDDRVPFGRDRNIYHVQGHNFGVADNTSRCVGCHVGHSMMELPEPTEVPAPIFSNLAPGADVVASSTRDHATRVSLVVDRRIAVGSVWRAAPGEDASLELSWDAPILARELVLHDATPIEQLAAMRVTASLRGDPVITGETRLERDGKIHLVFAAPVLVDRLQLALQSSDLAGALGASIRLGELEVIAAPSTGRAGEQSWFQRGDADCNGRISITDGIGTLRALFAGSQMCCEAAADVDGDDRVVLSDAVRLFQYLFNSGPEPTEPFTDCGQVELRLLSCETATCR